MPLAEEIVQAIDGVTLEMIEAVNKGQFDRIKDLMDIRQDQIKRLQTMKGKIIVSDASISRLFMDIKTLDELLKKKMKFAREKLEKISGSMDALRGYLVEKNIRIFDERR